MDEIKISEEEKERWRQISRDIARLDANQRIEDAYERAYDKAIEKAVKKEAISIYQEILQAFYNLDITPYLEKLREQPLDTLHALRKSLPKDKSLILQDLENL